MGFYCIFMHLNFCRERKVACSLILPKAIRHTTQGQIQTQKEVARTLASCILDTIYFTENSLKMIENFAENRAGALSLANLYPFY